MKKTHNNFMRHVIVAFMIVTTIINMVACNTPESEPEPSYWGSYYPGMGYTNTLSGAFRIESIIEEALLCYNGNSHKISEHYNESNTYSSISSTPQDSITILLELRVAWNDNIVDFYIDSIPLKGEPYNVTINTIVKGDIVLYNGTDTITSNATPIEIYGHLERLNFRPKSRELAPYLFDCDLNINTMIGQDSLKLKITSIYELE
ncbi:MAG: hypothetical protein IKC67_01555 [Odoribacter sp.]|nr:hypothetical protein [Odoribacter sp.]